MLESIESSSGVVAIGIPLRRVKKASNPTSVDGGKRKGINDKGGRTDGHNDVIGVFE